MRSLQPIMDVLCVVRKYVHTVYGVCSARIKWATSTAHAGGGQGISVLECLPYTVCTVLCN